MTEWRMKASNQSTRSTPKKFAGRLAPFRNKFSVFATTPWLISLTHDLPSSLVLSLPLKNRYLAAFPSTPRLPSPRCSPSRAIPSIWQIPNLLGSCRR